MKTKTNFHKLPGTTEGPNRVESVGICAAICTRDHPNQLRRALISLLSQSEPPDEILVVDNAPMDSRTQLLVFNEFPNINYCVESVLGLDFARNRALRETSKEIIAFLDDDGIADSGWIKKIREVFLRFPKAALCTGRIDVFALETEAQRIFQANGGLMANRENFLHIPNDLSKQGWRWQFAPSIAWAISLGSGCNMAVHRGLVIGLGGFDEALDLGPVLPGGGDHDMVWRVLESGGEVVYDPSVLVWHEHPRDLSATFHKIVGHHLGLIALLSKALFYKPRGNRLLVMIFYCWRLIKPFVRLLRRVIRKDPLPTFVLLRILKNSWCNFGLYAKACQISEDRAK